MLSQTTVLAFELGVERQVAQQWRDRWHSSGDTPHICCVVHEAALSPSCICILSPSCVRGKVLYGDIVTFICMRESTVLQRCDNEECPAALESRLHLIVWQLHKLHKLCHIFEIFCIYCN